MGKIPTNKCETITTKLNKHEQHLCQKQKSHKQLLHALKTTNTSTHTCIRREEKQQLIAITITTMVRPLIYRLDYHCILLRHPKLFSRFLESKTHLEIIITTLNGNRENLLHLACKYNRSEFIIPLVQNGCNPAKQNYDGLTPFHMALQHNHTECITEFLKLMATTPNFDDTPHSSSFQPPKEQKILQDLKEMFRFYTHTGYTIIHMTVLKNLPEILKDLLNFCRKHDIHVLRSEVLGCGDSLLHLAVKTHAIDVIKVILDLLPESLRTRNYAGVLPYDCDGMTDEMRQILRFKKRRRSFTAI